MNQSEALPLQAPIAIVGLGSLYPGSISVADFWRDIVAARDRLIEVPESHWLIEDYYDPDPKTPDKTYAKRGGFVPPVEFDPMEFAIPPSILNATDTAQLLGLIVARNVLDDMAAGKPLKINRDRTSVVLGFSGAAEPVGPLISRLQRPIWAKALREQGVGEAEIEAICTRIEDHYVPWQEASLPGLLGNVVAGRIANRLDLHGANLTTDAACASSLAAVHAAVNQLLLGEADLVLAGGVDANNDPFVYVSFSKTPALSPTGDCRPFSDKADGTMISEGLGMVALKRLDDAVRDGNRIYAVLRGVGFSSDGRSKSIYAPRSDGQARALDRAYARAGYAKETIELIEAHGTGTRAGDAAEMEGLRAVFGGLPETGKPHCAVGSVKSQIGHTAAAAGAAGLIKVAMALHQKVLPPTIKIDRPDPDLKLDQSPFYLNTRARPWIRGTSYPRRASVSAFGFGGTNYHVTLEEYIAGAGAATASTLRTGRSELFLYGAATGAALAKLAREASLGAGDFTAQARDSQLAFDAACRVRLAILAETPADLAAKLAEASACLAASDAPSLATPTGIYIVTGQPIASEVAFLFPGQGSQYVGMGAELAMAQDRARRVWDAAADRRFDGDAVHERVFPVPVFDEDARAGQEARLKATEWAQPALGLTSLSGFAVMGALGLAPKCFIGHSFGEVSALAAAGCFDPDALLTLARARGVAMRDAAVGSDGGMLALAADAATATDLIIRAGVGDQVVVANLNAPDETIVSGALTVLDRLAAAAQAAGLMARPLPVAAAFHSPAVASAAAGFAEALAGIGIAAPAVTVLGNADVSAYPADAAGIRERLVRQLAQPVRYAEQVEAAYDAGVRIFVEMGPGAVLSDLVGRILKDRPHLALSIDRKGRDGVASLHHALARLAVAGIRLDYAPLWDNYLPPKPKPVKRPGSTVMLSGTNYGKPYPPSAPDHARPAVAAKPREAVPSVATPKPAIAPTLQAPPPIGSADKAWLQTYQEIQRKTAETHAAVTKAMADSHAAFLAAMSASLAGLDPAGQGLAPIVAAPAAATVVPSQAPTPLVDPAALLLAVVAEKTGYQPEMLGLHMELEADLGIDSIKRVEILAALQAALPKLSDLKPSDMASIRTLGDIVAFLGGLPGVGAVPMESLQALERSAVRLTEQAPAGRSLTGLRNGRSVILTEDGGGVAQVLGRLLAAEGIAATIVQDVPVEADIVICLDGLRDVTDREGAIAVNRAVFRAARAVARNFADKGGVFVAVQHTGGDFGLSGRAPIRAWLGGGAGLVRTLRHEWPRAVVKGIDCAWGARTPEAIARVLLAELLEGGDTPDVALAADGRRLVPQRVVAVSAGMGPALSEGDVVVASGGARGVTAACLIELARQCRPHIVLLGRSVLVEEPACCGGAADQPSLARALAIEAGKAGRTPSPAEVSAQARAILSAREVHATLAAVEAVGAKATYLSVDIQDGAAVTAALANIRRTVGPIRALVHGAGVLADKRVADMSDAQFNSVFDTKVQGLRALLEATSGDDLAWICLFSSIVAWSGNEGQAAYAMANEVLNQVAYAEQARRGTACAVRAIGWGPWEGGMVTPALAQRFQSLGIPLIPLDAGARLFVGEGGVGPDAAILIGDCTGLESR